jgi:two-component system chemotaxis sensor kinase CheA
VYAVPADAVTAQLRLGDHARRRIARAAAIRIGDSWVALGRLDEALGADAGGGGSAADLPADAAALVLEAGGRRRAFAVDRTSGEHELLRRPAGALAGRHDVVMGCSVTGDGQVALWPSVLTILGGARASHVRARRASMPPPPRPRRVLVVDDSPIVVEIVTSILEGADLVTSTASDGEEAWSALEVELPDLLLTDVDMPRLDGLGLLCRVRERWPRLPVVMLTTHDRDVDRRHAMSLGASGYIVKAELDEGGLVETVRALIDAAEASAPAP